MEQYANFVCDLHGHTTRSDGNDTPLEFLLHAAERRMKIVAITDHDKTPPSSVLTDGQEYEITGYAKKLGLTLLKGIEISCETNIEDVHLVCFGCDWEDHFFRELDDFTIQSKVRSYKELVRRLGEKKMPVSWEEILDNHGNPVLEKDIQKKMIFNMMAEKGYTATWNEAKLLVKRDRDLTVNREKPKAADVIHEIHRQGGIVILAHPYLISEQVQYEGKELSRQDFIELLIYEGLDGIEARYTYDKTSYNGKLGKLEIYHEIIRRYQGRLPIISGGSDYHGDRKKGVKNPREIGECGITEKEFYQNRILRELAEKI